MPMFFAISDIRPTDLFAHASISHVLVSRTYQYVRVYVIPTSYTYIEIVEIALRPDWPISAANSTKYIALGILIEIKS